MFILATPGSIPGDETTKVEKSKEEETKPRYFRAQCHKQILEWRNYDEIKRSDWMFQVT